MKLDNTFSEIITYLKGTITCSESTVVNISNSHFKVKELLEFALGKLEAITDNTAVVQGYLGQRPPLPVLRPPPGAQIWLGPVVGIAAGLLGVGLLDSLFGNDESRDIENLNDQVQRVDKSIRVTNARIDILSKNVSNSLEDITLVLDKMQKFSAGVERKQIITWNLDQLRRVALNHLLLFRISENTLALLRAGIINTDIIDIKTLQRVITEGTTYYDGLEFMVENITKDNLIEIISLLEVQNLGQNRFVLIVPLVHKTKFHIYTLIPHPIMIANTLMIADINNILLFDHNNSYVITSSTNIRISKDLVRIKTSEPIWNIQHSTCEWQCFRQNLSEIIQLCNFRKFGTKTGIYLANTPQNRLLYLTNTTQVELDCPDGKIRDKLIGLHTIPSECDITTNSVHWPAKQIKEIRLKKLISTDPPNAFNIIHLPTLSINDTSPVHDSITKMIKELSPKGPLTLAFEDFDLSHEQVQSYALMASGIISIMVLINSTVIGILLMLQIRRWCKGRMSEPNPEAGTRIPFSSRDSLNLTPRQSFRRVKNKVNKLRASFSRPSSINSSFRSQVRNKGESLKRHLQSSVGDLRARNPRVVSTGTNTMYPNLSSGTSTPLNNKRSVIPLPAYP